MAFMGILIGLIFMIILLLLVVVAFGLLIAGIIVRKKRKKLSNKLFLIAGLNLILPTVFVVFIIVFTSVPTPKYFDTENGEVKIKTKWISKYEEYLKSNDVEGMRKLVDKHPEMIYYHDSNYVTLIEYGMYNLNVDFMQIAVDNGAVFDDPLIYKYSKFYNSFDSFLDRLGYPNEEEEIYEVGMTTDEMIETVEFMINHGAGMVYEKEKKNDFQNFYKEAYNWVLLDREMSDKDEKLLELIENNMDINEE